MFLLSRWAGGLVDRYGAKLPLVIGPIVAGVGLAMFMLPGPDAGSYWTSFFPAMMVLSVGMATSVAPLTTTVMSAVEERHAGIASGINNAVSRTAGLISVAVFGVVLTAVFAREFNRDLVQLNFPAETRSVLSQNAGSLAAIERLELPPESKQVVEQAARSAFVGGFRIVMLVAAASGLLSALAAILLIDGKQSGGGKD
jgi:MFS family permease